MPAVGKPFAAAAAYFAFSDNARSAAALSACAARACVAASKRPASAAEAIAVPDPAGRSWMAFETMAVGDADSPGGNGNVAEGPSPANVSADGLPIPRRFHFGAPVRQPVETNIAAAHPAANQRPCNLLRFCILAALELFIRSLDAPVKRATNLDRSFTDCRRYRRVERPANSSDGAVTHSQRTRCVATIRTTNRIDEGTVRNFSS